MEMKRISIYGYEVDVFYRVTEDGVEVTKATILEGTSAVAISSLDIVSEAQEILEADMLEEEDLFSEIELDKGKPF